jgi:hypothetical protein
MKSNRTRFSLQLADYFLGPVALVAVTIGYLPIVSYANAHDADWNVDVYCPATTQNRGAREVKFSFKAKVLNGELLGGLKSLPEAGSIEVKGKIDVAGHATLQVVGHHKDPENNVVRADVGTIYMYSVKAKFEGHTGKGERTTGRDCFYYFARS